MIIYTNSGAGHRRAAEALYCVATDYFPLAEIKLLDVLDYTTPTFRKFYPGTYIFMVNHCPWLWGLAYYFLDNRSVDRIARLFRRRTNRVHGRVFMEFLLEEKPDLILTTHFLPNELVSCLKKSCLFQTHLVTCLTDYYPHAWWRDSGVDLYIIPNQDLQPQLLRLGIQAEKIVSIGIPIHPDFEKPLDQITVRKKLGLSQQFTVIITSGGFGVGPVKKLIAKLKRITIPLQFIVICGKNEKLQEELLAFTGNTIHNFQIFGFVQNMQDFMVASNVIISKSGGLTSTEAMAIGLPLITLRPIPGQESGNCEFLIGQNAGVKVKNEKGARRAVENLLNNPDKLEELRQNMLRIGRPQAAREILAFVKEAFKIG
jgi:processive 1,2-diacylglycerol beta-glucosyltransferase